MFKGNLQLFAFFNNKSLLCEKTFQKTSTKSAFLILVYDKYTHKGYGAQRIATYLNRLGYQTRAGKPWHHSTIRAIVKNLTYIGVLRSGESRSEVLPHLQIISPELFGEARRIRTLRAETVEERRASVPLRTGDELSFPGMCSALTAAPG